MRRGRSAYLIFLLLALINVEKLFAQELSVGDKEQAIEAPIEVVADQLEYIKEERKVVAKGNVVITHRNYKLSADMAEVFTDTKKAYAEGHILLFTGEDSLSSQKAYYDFGKHQGSFPQGSSFDFPWYGYGEQIDQISRDQINIYNGTITTCNFENPHYDLKAERVVFYPNDRVILRNAFIRVQERPIFWFPYLSIPLGKEAPLEVIAGKSDDLGYYVRTAKGMSLGNHIQWKPHLDWFEEKGWGLGADVDYRLPKLGVGSLRLYEIKDEHSPNPRPRPGFKDAYEERMKRRRLWLSLRHKGQVDTQTSVVVQWSELSDEFLLRDFFEQEDRKENQPTSQVVVTRNSKDYGLMVGVIKRTNRFFDATEELPRVTFTWRNKPLFDTRLFYTHEQELVNFNSVTKHSGEDDDVVRISSTHELSYPLRYQGVSMTPFFNVRELYWTKKRGGDEHKTRNLLGLGVEARSRFYRLYNFSTNFLGLDINRIRHLMEPTFRYDSIRHEISKPEEFFGGGLTIQDTFQFGLDNTIQTKRHEFKEQVVPKRRVDLVSYAQFLTYQLKPVATDNESSFTDWRHEIKFRPYDWLLLGYEISYNFPKKKYSFATLDFILQKQPIDFVLSYSVVKDIFDSAEDSRQIMTDVEIQLNKRWKIGAYIRANTERENPVREWEIRAVRDLHDFLLEFGWNVRTSHVVEEQGHQREFFFEFKMKLFPEFILDSGNRARFVRPRIGRYVSGSNFLSAQKEEIVYHPS